MPLLILIIIATVTYTLFDVFASRAGNLIDSNLSATIFNGIGVIIPLIIYVFYKVVNGSKLIATTSSGIIYSILAGVSIAAFSVVLIKIFEKGGLAYVVPLIYGGAIALTALIGWVFYKESISLLQAIGIVTILAGVVIVIVSKLGSTAS
jgi:bacterial/archaeal transporter family protein